MTGAIGAADPYQLQSRAADPRYRATVRRLAADAARVPHPITRPTIDSRPSCNRQPAPSSAAHPRIAGVRRANRSRVDARASVLGIVAVVVARVGGVAVRRKRSDERRRRERPTELRRGRRERQRRRHGDGVVGPDSPIKHVIFIVKENRTFNNYFATYPGAEGATTGGTLTCTDGVCTPGPDYELKPAPDVPPHDITHGFSSGLYSINGGAMNGFNIIGSGEDMSGYTYFDRSGLPNYWAYADRFVLADHFFTSMFGPDVPGAPLHGGRASAGDRRQQEHDRSPGELLRRSHRVHAAFPRRPHRRAEDRRS